MNSGAGVELGAAIGVLIGSKSGPPKPGEPEPDPGDAAD